MPTDVRTSELVINNLTKQQYENIPSPDSNQLYLVPEDEEHKPILYPTTASDINTTSMVVKSSVDGNGKILTENGFVYNTSGNPTVSDTKVICDLGVGFFEKKLENLTMNTEYHIKSYGQNSSGLVYGSELVQSTPYSPIPAEYQLVEYLESSRTQYINTGYVPDTNDTIIFNVAFLSYPLNNAEFYGVQSTNPTKRLMFATNIPGVIAIYYSDTQSYQFDFDSIMHEYKYTSSNIFVDNTIVASNLCIYPNLPIYLFARNQNGSVERCTNSRCYNFSVIDSNNQYICRMYPVYRIADNKPGMYDIVNGVFYTNQGTGEFTVGPDKEWDE